MRSRTNAMLGAVASMAALGAFLVPVAAAQAGGAPAPNESGLGSGGQEYGQVVTAVKPSPPIASRFSVTHVVTAPGLPRVALRVIQPGARTVAARVVFLPQTET